MKRVAPALLLVPLALALAACGDGSGIARGVGADVSLADFTVAAQNLNAWYKANGTYADASTGLSAVILVRGDATSFCIQTAAEHEAGPGGSVLPGPC